MVVVSHLFFFFDKKFGEGVTRYESHPPSLELSISRQPLSFSTFSDKNRLRPNDFLCPMAYAVHVTDLCRLVFCFQFLRDSLCFFYLGMIQSRRFCACSSRSARYVQSFPDRSNSLYRSGQYSCRYSLCIRPHHPIGRLSSGSCKSGI
mgnify:CR=1 FL=1